MALKLLQKQTAEYQVHLALSQAFFPYKYAHWELFGHKPGQ